MGRFLIRRLLQLVPLFFVTTLVLHSMAFLLPGDEVRALFGFRAPPSEELEALRAYYGLDQHYLVQYGNYLARLAQGDLGRNFGGTEVSDLVAEAYPFSLRLFGATLVGLAVLLCGVWASATLRHGSPGDRIAAAAVIVVAALPVFVIANGLQFIVGTDSWLPYAGGGAGWRSYVLPALTLALAWSAFAARVLRRSVHEQVRESYLRAAIARGLPARRVLGVHALRNSLVPATAIVGAEAANFFGALILIEGLFQLPGLGGVVFRAIQAQEGTVIIGIVTMFAIAAMLVSLVTDILCAAIDPRIRLY